MDDWSPGSRREKEDQVLSANAYTVTPDNLTQSHRKLPFQAALPNTTSSPHFPHTLSELEKPFNTV